MTWVGIANIKGHFIHRLSACIEHSAGMIEAGIHNKAIDGVAIDFFKSNLQSVGIESGAFSELCNCGGGIAIGLG